MVTDDSGYALDALLVNDVACAVDDDLGLLAGTKATRALFRKPGHVSIIKILE